ncbi:MAG: ABC transporter substrate binding protein [candidate division FCPU426 bacterium]
MSNRLHGIKPVARMTAVLLFLAGWTCVVPAQAAKVKILLSRSSGPYEEVRESVQKQAAFETEAVFISGKIDEDQETVSRFKLEDTPLLLALGTQALAPVAKLDERIPVVYTLVFDPVPLPVRISSGVVIQIPLQDQLGKLAKLFPQRKQIGVLFNPDFSQELVNQAREAAESLGLRLLVVPVLKSADLPAALGRLQEGAAELIWMIADQTIVHPQAVKTIAEFSGKNRLPLIGLSLYHVQNGALAAFSVDFNDVGQQTAELAKRVLDGQETKAVEKPRKVIIYVNRRVKQQMQIKDLAELPEIQYVP